MTVKVKHNQDSFLEVLQSEIVAGTETLVLWIKHIEAHGGLEILFELETLLRAFRCFFDIRHLALSESERAELVNRSFAAELYIVREAIQVCEGLAGELVLKGRTRKVEFEAFIERQLRKDSVLDYHISKIVEQPTPLDSLMQLSESFNDLRVIIESIPAPKLDYQLFLSLGRCHRRDLRNCRYVEMLLAQRFRLQYDRVDNPGLSSVLRGIEDDRVRRNVSLSFLWLLRLLRYLQLIHRDLAADRPLRHSLVLFSLLHAEMGLLSDFLKGSILKGRDSGQVLRNAVELIVYSLKIEASRAFEHELVFAATEPDPAALYTKVENCHGLLRNCYQSCIVTLAQAFERGFAARSAFPSMRDSMKEAQLLREDLWNLRQFLSDILKNRSPLEPHKIVERIAEFRELSLRYLMYRDWGEFERLSDALITSNSAMEMRVLLRKFVNFLETLVEEVSKRSVLKESESDHRKDPFV